MPVHTPGQPADATYTGFDWDNPLNKAEKARLAPVLDVLTKCRAIAATEDESAVRGRQLLDIANARQLDLLVNLPPFPLPGELAPLTLADLTIFFAFWQANLLWMETDQTIPVTTAAGTANVTAKPLDVFRKVMAGSGLKL